MHQRRTNPSFAAVLPRLRTLALGSACLVWALSPLSATATPPSAPNAATTLAASAQVGVLKAVQGDVHVLRASSAPIAVKSGDPVHQTDQLKTGAKSGASLRLRDGTVLVMGPESQLDLKQYSFDTTTHDGNLLVSLMQGSLRMVSGLIAKKQPEAVRVETQTATIGIRGTDFIVTTDAQP